MPFEEAVRKAEAELRAEAALLEPHCPPSVGRFSQHGSGKLHCPPSGGRILQQESAVGKSSSSSVEELVEGYEDDFDEDTEIRTACTQ